MLKEIKTPIPKIVALHKLEDLVQMESKNEVLLNTKPNTQIHIIVNCDKTVIRFPYGNKFDVVNGCIIIHEK